MWCHVEQTEKQNCRANETLLRGKAIRERGVTASLLESSATLRLKMNLLEKNIQLYLML